MSEQDPKRSASELWAALEDEAMDDEMEAVLAMTPEERRRELREAGIDLERVHAQADALGAAPAPPAPAPLAPVTVLRPKRLRVAVVVPAAVALAAGLAVVVNLATSPAPVAAHRPPEPPAVRAEALRQAARDACQAQTWQTCLDKLNEAKALDPGGDESPEVQALRRSAGEPADRH
jgi:hypothetical protein